MCNILIVEKNGKLIQVKWIEKETRKIAANYDKRKETKREIVTGCMLLPFSPPSLTSS